MLDIETLSTETEAVVISIGAVNFFPSHNQTGFEFYAVVSDPEAQVVKGGHIGMDTVRWWMKQSEAAREVFNEGVGSKTVDVLRSLKEWISADPRDIPIWANGAGFDFPVLKNLFKRFQMEVPWDFRNERCYRTAKYMGPTCPDPMYTGTKHNALSDAIWQARKLMTIYNARQV